MMQASEYIFIRNSSLCAYSTWASFLSGMANQGGVEKKRSYTAPKQYTTNYILTVRAREPDNWILL